MRQVIVVLIGLGLLAGEASARGSRNTAPSVSVPSPALGTVTIIAAAGSTKNLRQLEIYVDGSLLALCPTSPCASSWDTTVVPDGPHTVLAKRVSTRGAVASSAPVTVLVDNVAPVPSACPVFPSDNPWNTDISTWPVHPNSANYLASIGPGNLHPDFGDIYGIPFTTVPGDQPRVPISFYYADESDPGPYPIPPDAPIEGGSDRHILVIDRDDCVLYEVYDAQPDGRGGWTAGSGAIWDLKINATRPPGWTSADAAGLPIFPGLVRYEEVVEQGAINHAVRFTVAQTMRGYVAPASHFASSSTNPNLPPMGLRLRLRANFDISGFHPQVQVILRALQRYGMLVADNGSSWFITGALDPRWSNAILDQLKTVSGSNFEVVYTGPVITP